MAIEWIQINLYWKRIYKSEERYSLLQMLWTEWILGKCYLWRESDSSDMLRLVYDIWIKSFTSLKHFIYIYELSFCVLLSSNLLSRLWVIISSENCLYNFFQSNNQTLVTYILSFLMLESDSHLLDKSIDITQKKD